jgi:hypothetical protein
MLAGTDPDRTLDTRRLSDFLPRREKSHGASRVHRIHLRQCSQPQNRQSLDANLWQHTQIVAQPDDRDHPRPNQAALRNLSACMRRAPDRRGLVTRLSAPPLLADPALRRGTKGDFRVLLRRAFLLREPGQDPKVAPATAIPERTRGEQREAAKTGNQSESEQRPAQRKAVRPKERP